MAVHYIDHRRSVLPARYAAANHDERVLNLQTKIIKLERNFDEKQLSIQRLIDTVGPILLSDSDVEDDDLPFVPRGSFDPIGLSNNLPAHEKFNQQTTNVAVATGHQQHLNNTENISQEVINVADGAAQATDIQQPLINAENDSQQKINAADGVTQATDNQLQLNNAKYVGQEQINAAGASVQATGNQVLLGSASGTNQSTVPSDGMMGPKPTLDELLGPKYSYYQEVELSFIFHSQ